jgi:hypothetical protein
MGRDPTEQRAEGRIRRSWRLTSLAWDLIRRDRTLLLLALMGVAFSGAAAFLLFYFAGYGNGSGSRGHLALLGLIVLYPATLIGVFFNVALAKATSESLEGKPTSAKKALRYAVSRLDQIALWSLISVLVGLILEQIASRLPWASRIATALVGAAWALATIFVVPILAIEGVGALDSIKRSSQLIRKRWGEGLAGSLTIGFWTVIVIVPVAFIFCIALGLTRRHAALAGTIAMIDIVVLVLISSAVAALRQVFAVVLYRYATAGAAGGFPVDDLEDPFSSSKGDRNSQAGKGGSWRTIGFVLAGFTALLFMVAIFVPQHHQASYNGSAAPTPTGGEYSTDFPWKYQSMVHAGMHLYYFQDPVGKVDYRDNDFSTSQMRIHFHIHPSFQEKFNAMNPRIDIHWNRGRFWLLVIPETSDGRLMTPAEAAQRWGTGG